MEPDLLSNSNLLGNSVSYIYVTNNNDFIKKQYKLDFLFSFSKLLKVCPAADKHHALFWQGSFPVVSGPDTFAS